METPPTNLETVPSAAKQSRGRVRQKRLAGVWDAVGQEKKKHDYVI